MKWAWRWGLSWPINAVETTRDAQEIASRTAVHISFSPQRSSQHPASNRLEAPTVPAPYTSAVQPSHTPFDIPLVRSDGG